MWPGSDDTFTGRAAELGALAVALSAGGDDRAGSRGGSGSRGESTAVSPAAAAPS